MTPKNQSWVNISSAAKANGFFDSEKLSPSNIGDEYSTLTTSEMAEFYLADNRAEFCSKLLLPILDQVVQDCTDLGDFEVWSTESIPVPVKIQRKCRVALHEWYNYFSNFSGQLCNATEKDVRCRISAGGLESATRPVAWKFLLGIYEFDSKLSDRDLKDRYNELTYLEYKNAWKSQIKRDKALQENLYRIQKDVVRTDRTQEYHQNAFDFESIELVENISLNPALERLMNVLMTYTASYPLRDDSFVQGMADLASMILMSVQNEVDAFWCFAALMEKFKGNFREDGSGMKIQLAKLRKLVLLTDPILYRRLDDINASNFFCAYRWLLVLFRREFSVIDTQILWDFLFAEYYSEEMHLFIAAAILQRIRYSIMTEVSNSDDLLKLVNNLVGKLDVNKIIVDATELFLCFEKELLCQK